MESDPSERSRATSPRFAIRAAAYLALLLAFTAPVSLDPASRRFADGPDTRLYQWTLGWDLHALKTDPLHIFDANIFFPEKRTLAYSEHLIGAAILALPLSFLTSNPDAILNFVLLLSTLLTALGSDFLARASGATRRGALLAGVIGGFSGVRLGRLTQAHLATLHFVPWSLGFAVRYVREGRRKDLLIALAFFTAQALTSGHGGLFLALALAVIFGGAFVSRRLDFRTFTRNVGAAGGLILLLNLPFVIPYYEARGKVGLTRLIEDAEGYAPSGASWIVSPTRVQSVLIGLFPPLRDAALAANAALFPGWIAAILGAIGIVQTMSKRLPDSAVAWTLVALAGLTFWLCLGPGFGLYRVFYSFVPGFDLIRVPSRFILLTLTALATLAALGLDRIRTPGLAWVLIAVAAIECVPLPWTSARDPLVTPPIDAWLARQKMPFRVVELPVPPADNSVRQARFHSEYMIHGAAHWQPMVNGYSSLVPPASEKLFTELREFPTEAGLSDLERLGIGYVIVHTDMYQPDRWAEKEAQLRGFGERIRLARVEGEGRAYEIVRAPRLP